MNLGPRSGEIFVRDVLATDANALVDALEMRRGVEARAQTRGAQDGFEHRGRGAFAVGAGDMRAGRGALRLAESLRKNGDIFEAELLDERLLWRGQFPPQRKKRANGFLVRHEANRRKNRGRC